MKDAISTFIKEHPFLTFFIVDALASAVKNTIVGVAEAITGNFPESDISQADDESETDPCLD